MVELTNTVKVIFYENFKYISAFKIFVFMIFSLGFYFINWIYLTNVNFKKSGVDIAPNPEYGLKFMFLVPFVWLMVTGVFKKIFTVIDYSVLFWVDVIGWMLIMIMMLEYMYRFCMCFGKFTNSNGLFWYLFLWVGFFPLALLPFGKYFFLPLLIFSLLTVPVMQMKLNHDYINIFGGFSE